MTKFRDLLEKKDPNYFNGQNGFGYHLYGDDKKLLKAQDEWSEALERAKVNKTKVDFAWTDGVTKALEKKYKIKISVMDD